MAGPLSASECYLGGHVTISYPGGVDVALVENETETQVKVSYLKEMGSGMYSPYVEMREKTQIISKLSWPQPKGFRTSRELSLQIFSIEEINHAQKLWRASRGML